MASGAESIVPAAAARAQTREQCEGELAELALEMHRLQMAMARCKAKQLFLRRRVRRFELEEIKAEYGDEAGVEDDLSDAPPSQDAPAADAPPPPAAVAARPVAAAPAVPAGRKRAEPAKRSEPASCKACVNKLKLGHQNGVAPLRKPPCELPARGRAPKAAKTGGGAAEAQAENQDAAQGDVQEEAQAQGDVQEEAPQDE